MSVIELWLPILCTGIATHILSTLAWTVLPHHKPEWTKIPHEDEFQEWLASKSIGPGQYIFPHTSGGAEFSSDGYQAKLKKNTGTIVLWGTPTNMGKAIVLTLCFFLFIAFVIGYLASIAFKPGESFMQVFRFVATLGLVAHCSAKFPNLFWFRRKFAMDLVDGAAFALASGLIFALLWPSK